MTCLEMHLGVESSQKWRKNEVDLKRGFFYCEEHERHRKIDILKVCETNAALVKIALQ